jgi:hypothetical protein
MRAANRLATVGGCWTEFLGPILGKVSLRPSAGAAVRHLNTCQHQTILHAKPPRAECGEHGVPQVPLLDMASTPQEEDVFTFGPDLVEQLRRKIEITNNQLREDQA